MGSVLPIRGPKIPMPGARFTCSRGKTTGDRSYTHDIFKCLWINPITVCAEREGEMRSYQQRQVLLEIAEYDFELVPGQEV